MAVMFSAVVRRETPTTGHALRFPSQKNHSPPELLTIKYNHYGETNATTQIINL